MLATSVSWSDLCRQYVDDCHGLPVEGRGEATRKFVEAVRSSFSGDSTELAEALEVAGDNSATGGQFGDAAGYYEEALALAMKRGARPIRARLGVKLSHALADAGRGDDALRRGEEALGAFEEMGDFSQHGILLNQLGILCRRQGHLEQSESYYRQAIKLARETRGPSHPDVATAMNNLGVMLMDRKDFVQAESVLMEALGIREKSFGPMHPEVAQSMANLGAVYHWTGQTVKAGGYYQGAIQIYQAFSLTDDAETAAVRENMAALAAANQA